MPNITTAGQQLTLKIVDAVEPTQKHQELLSLICRHAKSYCRIQERWCNEHMDERTTKDVERREANLERRIESLAACVNTRDKERLDVKFQGDPRGPTVLLVLPHPWRHLHNHPDGVAVPNS